MVYQSRALRIALAVSGALCMLLLGVALGVRAAGGSVAHVFDPQTVTMPGSTGKLMTVVQTVAGSGSSGASDAPAGARTVTVTVPTTVTTTVTQAQTEQQTVTVTVTETAPATSS